MIKVLVMSVKGGSGKYRCIDPHVYLQNKYGNEFYFDIREDIDYNNDEFLKKYDMIFIHRAPSSKDGVGIMNKLKKLGIKVVIDIDDYWMVDPSHSLYTYFKESNLDKTIIECLRLADYVTTTTPILANIIKPINKNVIVLENTINSNEIQFKPNKEKSEKVRFGWLGGSSHIKDLELLKSLGEIQPTISPKMQLVLCGFDLNGSIIEINPETNERRSRPIKPEESVWFLYEIFFTNNYRNLLDDVNYIQYLAQFNHNPNYDDKNKPYRRVWTKNINQYANNYNLFDVSLAPLKDNKFNLYKSQLKIIESGFHHNPIIAQNYGPYQIDLINAYDKGGVINSKGNSLLVDNNKNHKMWGKYAKLLINNPNLIEDLGEKLYETVKDKYNLNNVSLRRYDLYKKICE